MLFRFSAFVEGKLLQGMLEEFDEIGLRTVAEISFKVAFVVIGDVMLDLFFLQIFHRGVDIRVPLPSDATSFALWTLTVWKLTHAVVTNDMVAHEDSESVGNLHGVTDRAEEPLDLPSESI